jgi:hypothetical protein
VIDRREALNAAFSDFFVAFPERVAGVDPILLSDFADAIWAAAIEHRDREIRHIKELAGLERKVGVR